MDIEKILLDHEKRLRIIEKRHNDRADAMHDMDEAMEEQADTEHGPY